MSVCKYDGIYFPMLFRMKQTLSDEEFKKFVEDNFSNAQEVLYIFSSDGSSASVTTPSWQPDLVSSRTGKTESANDTTQKFYTSSSRSDRMKNNFKKRIVESSIYNLKTNTFVQANTFVGDRTHLNANLTAYKKELLDIIAEYCDIQINDYERDYPSIITEFKSKILTAQPNDAYYNAFDAYVTFSNFDELLAKETTWIKVNTTYKSPFHPKRYEYIGPTVQHYTGFSTNEHSDQEETVGDLVKILLDYLPKYGEPNSSISLPGFNSTMMAFKQWVQDSTNPEIIAEWNKGVNANMKFLLEQYMSAKHLAPQHKTYLSSTLRGIYEYIFASNIDDSIKQLFNNLIRKTVRSSYYEYVYGLDGLGHKNLTERLVKMQETAIQDSIAGVSEYWKTNKNGFSTLSRKWNFYFGDNYFTLRDLNSSEIITITIKEKAVTYEGNFTSIDELVKDLTLLDIPENFEDLTKQVFGRTRNTTSLYLPIISTILGKIIGKNYNLFYGNLREIAKVQSIIYGADIKSVIKDADGNNLPLYQMTCLAYNHKAMWSHIQETMQYKGVHPISPYLDNIVFNNISNIKSPTIRSKVTVESNGTTKSTPVTKLNYSDVMFLSIDQDFFANLMQTQSIDEGASASGIIALQSHVYSDKNRHFLMMFDLNPDWIFENKRINFKTALTSYIQTGDNTYLAPIYDIWFESNKKQYNTYLQVLLDDYNYVFDRTGENELKTIEDLKNFIATHKDIEAAFKAKGREFINEFHLSKNGLNETFEYLYNTFNDRTKFNNFVKKRLRQFKSNLTKVRELLSQRGAIYESGIDIDRVINAYFVIDSFLSNEYNKMMVGEVFIHPNKNDLSRNDAIDAIIKREGEDIKTDPNFESLIQDELLDYSISSRWIAQVKRMVIYGATYHSYAQGLKYGVPKSIKMAVMSDFPAMVYNTLGDSSKNDSMDGCGYTSPYLSRMENVSLMDAAVKSVNKTIYADIDGTHGRPKLLKWAEYAMTNAIRRHKGDIRIENIYRKAHSIPFTTNINYDQTFDNSYFLDPDTGKYYQIKRIIINTDVNGNNVATRVLQQVDSRGKAIGEEVAVPFNDANDNPIVINTIYKINQLFGGAYYLQLNESTNDLQYSEANLDIETKFICDYNLKDHMIGWVVNKSAVKVGASNVNNASSWMDDSELLYTTMSTEFGGLQMDSDHELDDADVTEASQMISSLEQNGYTHDIATAIYEEIGQFCAQSVKELNDALDSEDSNLLYQIFGKAVIQAFQSGSKDTLGLAQSFIALATASIKENKIEYKIPFSSSSINGIFNSTVTTNIIKRAIKRHYAGVSAVLNPSHNVVMYHEINGQKYKSEELIPLAIELSNQYGFRITVDDLLDKIYLDDAKTILNPYLEPVADTHDIDFEDTIVILTSDQSYPQIIKIDTYEKYDYYHNNKPDNVIYYKWTIKPKNLKGADTKFTYTIDGTTHKDSMFNSVYTKLLYYIFNDPNVTARLIGKTADSLSSELKAIVKDRWAKFGITGDFDVNVLYRALWDVLNMDDDVVITELDILQGKKTCALYNQNILDCLDSNTPFMWNGYNCVPTSVTVQAAQIAMGKLYAKQLGLLPGDSLAKIKYQGVDFFINRIQGYYNNPLRNTSNIYDWVLYDGTGKKLYVKLKETNLQVGASDNYTQVEDRIYYNGEDFCSAEGKQFYSFTENDEEYDLVVVDSIDRFRELRNGHFVLVERNYNSKNRADIVREEYGSENSNLIMINGRNIVEYDIDTLMQQLNANQFDKLKKKIVKLAQAKYEAFEKSLLFIGTRIPCQSMQSFSAMEVVLLTDSETNEIYVPVNIMWLEGSDLDIDKQYVMGYSVSDNGYIYTQTKENSPHFMKEMALKNRIVSKIHNILLNPRNQINLTQPVTVDQIKALAKKSSMGLAARYMNGWDPSSKYRMQIENMVGKAVIGNVATAIKSFFALSNLYNTKFREIYNLIMSGNYDVAREMLKKYTFTRNGKLLTLANTNLEMFSTFKDLIFPENQKDLQQMLLDLKKNVDLIEDQSMILGALLNSATDNAKELILKKINADANWVDIYCVSLMLGDKIDTIGNFMLDPVVSEIINSFENSVFDATFISKESLIKTRIRELESEIQDLLKSNQSEKAEKLIETKRKLETLLECVWSVEEIQRLGKMLKINQGIPTNLEDFYVYVKSIENYIKKRLNVDFDIHRFILDEDYKQQSIIAYERNKRNFNILEVISEVPHFAEMFKTISTNRRILDRLSIRNALTNKLLDTIYHRVHKTDYKTGEEYIASDPNSILNIKERTLLFRDVTDFLINQWILQSNINVTVPAGVLDYVAEDKLYIQDVEHIDQLRNYIEQFVIPVLKEQLPENKFIASLTLGIKQGKSFFKLPFNMLQIDNTQKTRSEYESVLLDFNKLREVQIQGIDMNLIDIFYLYNLIVNKDKFGPNSLTRIFEDILSLDEDHTLLIWNFNDWIDQQDVDTLFFDFFKTYKDWRDFSKVQALTFNDVNNSSNAKLVITPKFDSDKTVTIKASIANKFIGFGPENGSTYYYAQQAGSAANTGNYTEQDVIFVSVPGKRGDEQTSKQYQDQTIREAIKAIEAGATLITDSAEYLATSDYNEGERRLAQNLQHLGYQYETIVVDGDQIGKWTNPKITSITTSKPKVEIYQGYWTRADVASQTDKVFLFGDNTEDRIMGHIPISTQAVIRGLPNAIGIDTKKNRGTSEPKLFHPSSEYNVKPGSIVVYNNSRYLVRRINDSGRVQLYKEDGSKYPGTPLVGSIQQVLGYFPTVSYNSHEYIVTDNGNIYSTAKDGGLSYVNASPERTRILEEAKKYMTTNSSYFTDADFDIFKAQVDEAIQRAVNSGKTIVIPADGIGTGKAELAKRAPKLFAYLQQKLDELQNLDSAKYTDTHWDEQFDNVGVAEETVVEEAVTIGFNSVNENDIYDLDPNDHMMDEMEFETISEGIGEMESAAYVVMKAILEANPLSIADKSKLDRALSWLILNYPQFVSDSMRSAIQNRTPNYFVQIDDDTKQQISGQYSKEFVRTNSEYSPEYRKDPYVTTTRTYGEVEDATIISDESMHTSYNPTPIYQTTPSIQSKLIELVRQANENGIKGIHVVTSADLIHESPEIQNAKGFVRDGEIYINVNRAGDDTVIHEFGHIYLAYAKVTNPDAYYALLEKVRKTELWAKMKTWYVYRNKVGSDFDEEVLATIIGNYYNKQSINQEKEIALEAINLLPDDFKQLFESDILPNLDDTFIDNYRLSQRIATKKNQLLIKEDC